MPSKRRRTQDIGPECWTGHQQSKASDLLFLTSPFGEIDNALRPFAEHLDKKTLIEPDHRELTMGHSNSGAEKGSTPRWPGRVDRPGGGRLAQIRDLPPEKRIPARRNLQF
jgi:hypothetical protein